MAENANKKVSVSAIDKLIKYIPREDEVLTLSVGEDTIEVKVKQYIDLQELCDMVEFAVDNCFQKDADGEEHYVAAMEEFAKDVAMLRYMTNIKNGYDVDEKSLDKLYRRLYDLCTHTCYIDMIWDKVPKYISKRFCTAFCDQMHFRKQRLLSGEHVALQSVLRQLDAATESITAFGAMFEDLDMGEVAGALQKVNGYTGPELVRAVIDARSDEFSDLDGVDE